MPRIPKTDCFGNPLEGSAVAQDRSKRTETRGRPKKVFDGPRTLRTHQIRVLRAIASAAGPISRPRIAEIAGIGVETVQRAIGLVNPERRSRFEHEATEGGYP
jgi:hypothetical protein